VICTFPLFLFHVHLSLNFSFLCHCTLFASKLLLNHYVFFFLTRYDIGPFAFILISIWHKRWNRAEKTSVLSTLINKTNAQEMKWIIMIILKGFVLTSIVYGIVFFITVC
jgi:hypothetical protein